MHRLLLPGLCAALIVACAAADDPEERGSPGAEETGTVTTEDQGLPDSEPGADTLESDLRYTVSGGIAGRTQELLLERDGSATVTVDGDERARFQLSAEELATLSEMLATTDLGALAGSRAEGEVMDDRVLELTHGNDRVTVDESALEGGYPPLFSNLNGYLARAD